MWIRAESSQKFCGRIPKHEASFRLDASAKGAEMNVKQFRRKSWWLTTGIAIGYYIAVRMAQRGKELEEPEEEDEDEYED